MCEPKISLEKYYQELMQSDPTSYGKMTNSKNQVIEFYEHPEYGDEHEVICICHELKLACDSTFFETDDMESGDGDYEPSFIDGVFYIGEFEN